MKPIICDLIAFIPHAFAVSLLDTSTDSYGADDFGSDQDPEPEPEAGNESGRFEEEEVIDEEVIDEEVEESFDVDAGDDDYDGDGSGGYSNHGSRGRMAAPNASSAQSRQQQHVRLC
jgi:hypothetical protein